MRIHCIVRVTRAVMLFSALGLAFLVPTAWMSTRLIEKFLMWIFRPSPNTVRRLLRSVVPRVSALRPHHS